MVASTTWAVRWSASIVWTNVLLTSYVRVIVFLLPVVSSFIPG